MFDAVVDVALGFFFELVELVFYVLFHPVAEFVFFGEFFGVVRGFGGWGSIGGWFPAGFFRCWFCCCFRRCLGGFFGPSGFPTGYFRGLRSWGDVVFVEVVQHFECFVPGEVGLCRFFQTNAGEYGDEFFGAESHCGGESVDADFVV